MREKSIHIQLFRSFAKGDENAFEKLFHLYFPRLHAFSFKIIHDSALAKDVAQLVIRLQRWYDVDIDIKNPELNGILYSVIFKNEETIWQVLNTFQLTLPIRYTRVGFR